MQPSRAAPLIRSEGGWIVFAFFVYIGWMLLIAWLQTRENRKVGSGLSRRKAGPSWLRRRLGLPNRTDKA